MVVVMNMVQVVMALGTKLLHTVVDMEVMEEDKPTTNLLVDMDSQLMEEDEVVAAVEEQEAEVPVDTDHTKLVSITDVTVLL